MGPYAPAMQRRKKEFKSGAGGGGENQGQSPKKNSTLKTNQLENPCNLSERLVSNKSIKVHKFHPIVKFRVEAR